MTKSNISPKQASELVKEMTGEIFSPRRIIYMSRHAVAGFPPLSKTLWSKFFRFNREEIESWVVKNFGYEMVKKKRKRGGGDAA